MLQTSSGLRTVPLGSSLALEVEEVRVYQHRERRNPNPRGGFLTRKKIEQNYSRSYSKRSYTEPDQRPPRLGRPQSGPRRVKSRPRGAQMAIGVAPLKSSGAARATMDAHAMDGDLMTKKAG